MSEPLALSTSDNVLSISGGFLINDYRKVLAAIHNIQRTRSCSHLVVDFSGCTFTHPPPMVALICDCMRQRSRGIEISLRLPQKQEVRRLFLNTNWAHLLEPESYSRFAYSPNRHKSATLYADGQEQGVLVNQIIDTLLSNFRGLSRAHLKAIEWSVNEITDNVLVHSGSENGGVVQVTAQRTRKRVEFVVGDAGVGVAKSLRDSDNSITSDVDALSRAIREGVTRDKSVGQGNGLYGSYKLSVGSKGAFSISSNRATLYFNEATGMHSKTEAVPFHGSLVVCCIDYTNPLLLEQALRFSDRVFDPVDLVAIRYETDTEGQFVS